MKIFIQIASYRDPQLVPTLKDMIANAKKPKNLVFAIARQFNETDGFDNLDEYRNDKRFKILDIPYQEAQGVCWARNLTQQLYDGETYTLQIDSHMRFVKDWDDILIKMIKGLQKDGYKKPLLTGYVPSFDPENDPAGRAQDAWRMVFDRFIPEGAVFFLPETIPGWREMKKPVTARFYSAHFCFTLGEFSTEVQHNPEYYFHGEEISIAARALANSFTLTESPYIGSSGVGFSATTGTYPLVAGPATVYGNHDALSTSTVTFEINSSGNSSVSIYYFVNGSIVSGLNNSAVTTGPNTKNLFIAGPYSSSDTIEFQIT